MSTTWNPEQYEKFKAQRSKPFSDLLSLVKSEQFDFIIDLGCGTGELTRELFDKLKPKQMLAIDSSEEMLQKAFALVVPRLNFKLENISDYNPEHKIGLLFSNAALQWLPDHESLFPKILSWVKQGGQVAIQMPYNFEHPSHTIARDVATQLFPNIFSTNFCLSGTLSVERYSEILFRHGFEEQTCRIEVYGHPLSSGHEVVEWTKGTLLTSYQERLSESEFIKFVEEYRRELVKVIGEEPYYYAFKRMLLWGKK